MKWKTTQKWKLIQQQDGVVVIFKCESQKPSNIWNNNTGTCKRSAQKAGEK